MPAARRREAWRSVAAPRSTPVVHARTKFAQISPCREIGGYVAPKSRRSRVSSSSQRGSRRKHVVVRRVWTIWPGICLEAAKARRMDPRAVAGRAQCRGYSLNPHWGPRLAPHPREFLADRPSPPPLPGRVSIVPGSSLGCRLESSKYPSPLAAARSAAPRRAPPSSAPDVAWGGGRPRPRGRRLGRLGECMPQSGGSRGPGPGGMAAGWPSLSHAVALPSGPVTVVFL